MDSLLFSLQDCVPVFWTLYDTCVVKEQKNIYC